MREWRPHPKQELALQRVEFEVLFGGARGGGKTDSGLVFLLDDIQNPRYRALVIRRNSDDLSDWVNRAVEMYSDLGAKIAYRPAEIRFPSGAIIKTGHLKDEQAYTKYQGHEYQRMVIEELTQIPDEKRYMQLLSSCRSTVEGMKAQVFCTTNPGGVGHLWVKKRFVDVAEAGVPFTDPISGRKRIFIPSTIDDNPTLTEADPQYIKFLDSLKATDEELYKAWRLGDWDSFAGQFFREFRRDLHMIERFAPTRKDLIIGGLDWGYSAPFSMHLTTISKEIYEGVKFYRARTFFEMYGTEKIPKEWAPVITERLKGFGLTFRDVTWIQADPAVFNKGTDGSVSIRDQFVQANELFRVLKRGSNDRIPGWVNMRKWLSIAPDGLPYWQISENCHNLLTELGSAVHDENIVEDLEAEFDHALDDQRYQFKSLKWIDAKAGGVGRTRAEQRYKQTAAVDPTTGKLVSIDTDKFAQPKKRLFYK